MMIRCTAQTSTTGKRCTRMCSAGTRCWQHTAKAPAPATVQESKLLNLPVDLEREIYNNMDVHTLKNVFESHRKPSSVVKEVLQKKMGELVGLLDMLMTFDALDMKLVFEKKHYKVQLDINVMYSTIDMTFRETSVDEQKMLKFDLMHPLSKIPVKDWRFHDKSYREHYSFLVLFMELLRIGSKDLKCIVDFEKIRRNLAYPFRIKDTEEEKVRRETAPERATLLQERLLAWIKNNVAPSSKAVKDDELHVVNYLRDFEIIQVELNKTRGCAPWRRNARLRSQRL